MIEPLKKHPFADRVGVRLHLTFTRLAHADVESMLNPYFVNRKDSNKRS